jgi:Family of unknown function (DUF5906)
MRLDFLSAADGSALTKQFTLDQNNKIQTKSYPFIRDFSSEQIEVSTLTDMYKAIESAMAQGKCLLKGLLDRPLTAESRAGHTTAHATTRWLCLDIDVYEGFASIDELLTSIDPSLQNTSYIFQHSASAGIKGEAGIRGHVFIMLSSEASPETIKQWLIHKNMTTPALRDRVELSANGLTLRYPLDITTCQNDKLIYIAAPVCDGIDDPLGAERLVLCTKSEEMATLPFATAIAKNQQDVDDRVNELRKTAGLKKRTPKYKQVGKDRVLTNPDLAAITDYKEERGFCYLNLNHGDSWAYYFPTDNHEIVYNFKGEPPVRLIDVAPDFYAALQVETGAEQEQDETIKPLVFRDPVSDTYFNGYYHTEEDRIDLHQVSSVQKIEHFLAQHKIPEPDFIEDWDYRFDPTTNKVIDFKARRANRFQPTPYMRDVDTIGHSVPLNTRKVIMHALGNDKEAYDHFLNWLAYMFQTRKKPGTAWVLHGTQGTGKGLILNEILTPLFGAEHVLQLTTQSFQDQFNASFETALLVWIDEFQLPDGREQTSSMNKLKNLITEPKLVIRAMRRNASVRDSFIGVIIATNHSDPIPMTANDRRMNIAPSQDEPLDISHAEIEALRLELAQFAAFLRDFEVNEEKVRRPLLNKARQAMIEVSENTKDEFFRNVTEGNLEYFLAHRPPAFGSTEYITAPAYRSILANWCRNQGKEIGVPRDDLMIMYNFIRKTATSTSAFGRMISIAGKKPCPIRTTDKGVVRGVKLVFNGGNGDEIKTFLEEQIEASDKLKQQQ